MLKGKHVELLWTPEEHNSATRLAFEPKFHGLCFSSFQYTLLVEGMHSRVPAQPGSVPAFPLLSTLHFNNRNKSQARESHFHPGSRLCMSECTSSASAFPT